MNTGMILQESELVPYHLSPPPGERIVVLAPHPDDETLGCGGTVRLLVEAEKKIKVLFLTSGERGDPANPESHSPLVPPSEGGKVTPPIFPLSKGRSEEGLTPPSPPLKLRGGWGALLRPAGKSVGEFTVESHITEYSMIREKEAERALRVLGVSDYEFLRFPDRGIHEHYQDALQRVLGTIEEFSPDAIYAPSMVELNPDHRAAAALSMEIQGKYTRGSAGSDGARPVTLVFYEVTTPLRPNVLVDITPVYRRKKRAMKRYRSQLRVMDYLGHITALNTIRALTVNGPRYVEAFWSVEKPLGGEDIAQWLSYQETLGSRG